MVDMNDLAKQLEAKGHADEAGISFEVNPIPGDVDLLQITVEDREELPVYLSASDEQILCICYLFHMDEVNTELKADMNHAMLASNIAVPLSSFAIIDERYVIFGALSVNSSLEDILHEIEVLSDNSVEALEAMQDFLN